MNKVTASDSAGTVPIAGAGRAPTAGTGVRHRHVLGTPFGGSGHRRQQRRLGGGEFFIGEHALFVEFGELGELPDGVLAQAA